MDKVYTDKSKCTGCGLCQNICPEKAISMKQDEEGFLYPVIDKNRCIDCGQCTFSCPENKVLPHYPSKAYLVRCRDRNLLKNSSSGGAFSLIANRITEYGGLVSGACFDEAFCLVHILSRNITGMRKSKYVQSDIVNQFTQIQEKLKDGRKILFTGTPCQCKAIQEYLGEKQNLYIMSVACRGVQSPGFWQEYVRWLKDTYGQLEFYDFRDKSKKNNAHTIACRIVGKETIYIPYAQDPLSHIYMKCLDLRPSCYACRYCNANLPFDFTIGDFWGVEKTFPAFDDGLGTSFLIVHTLKAEELTRQIVVREDAEIIPCNIQDIIQPALQSPAPKSILRKLFFKDFAKKNEDGYCDIPRILKKYG